jgi:hypothetical protein
MQSSGILRRVAVVNTDVSEKHRFLQEPQPVKSQKMSFFIVIDVKPSNVTWTKGI